jgi:hypothetical protein
MLELDPALDPRLHLGSSNQGLTFFSSFPFDWNQLIFPPKCCHVGVASVYHFLVFDPHLKVPCVQFMTLIEYFDGSFSKNHDIFNISQIKAFSMNIGL